MAKSNFLLVDLNEPKTKKLAETITSETSRKILNHLTEKEDTEANIAKLLNFPISTVHYHLQKLQEAQLVIVDEFHYSTKGREVNHYKLANKYIIIAPRKISGLKEKLKSILPVGAIVVGVSVVLKYMETQLVSSFAAAKQILPASTPPIIEVMEQKVAPLAVDVSQEMATRAIEIGSPALQELSKTAATTINATSALSTVGGGQDQAMI